MALSMTGFGKSNCELKEKTIQIEIRSLNSKQMDAQLRIPSYFREKELEIRNLLAKYLIRGKIDLTINEDISNDPRQAILNEKVIKAYFEQIQQIFQPLGIQASHENVIQAILRLPEAIKYQQPEILNEWSTIVTALEQACMELIKFRKQEGDALTMDITNRINRILALLQEVVPWEQNRMEMIKNNIKKTFTDFASNVSIDSNRFEQELIYYLEKIDITEEKIRLANHCNYFIECMQTDPEPGKKLGFITQEIGREINTLGSKANNSDIQKIVVQMKDELEKIKEQSLNLL